jgi:hypothetical protein
VTTYQTARSGNLEEPEYESPPLKNLQIVSEDYSLLECDGVWSVVPTFRRNLLSRLYGKRVREVGKPYRYSERGKLSEAASEPNGHRGP